MVNLPIEIIDHILREYKGDRLPCILLPLVSINRSWQAVVESHLWTYLRIRPQEIGCFRAAFNKNPRRRRALKYLDIRFEFYFAQGYRPRHDPASPDDGNSDEETSNEGDDDPCKICPRGQCQRNKDPFGDEAYVGVKSGENMPPPRGLAATRTEHERFFREVKAIWDELASWKEDLQLPDIQFYFFGRSIYDSLGPEICEDSSLNNKALLEFPKASMLPSLTSVKSLRVREELNYEIDLWPATVACNITSSLPMLECLDIMGVDNWRLWPLARRNLRHSKDTRLRM